MCHKYTGPELLDQETWEKSVLPNMALRLGLKMAGKTLQAENDEEERILLDSLNVYPDIPLISKEDWNLIAAYYSSNAPKSMPKPFFSNDKKGVFPFIEQTVTIDNSTLPQVTLLEYDTLNSALYIGDFKKLFSLNASGEILNEWNLDDYAVDLEFSSTSPPILMEIGKIAPSNKKLGKLTHLDKANNGRSLVTGFSELRRPVQMTKHDLNQDGNQDLIVCNFGHSIGKLAWYDAMDFSKEYILNLNPGTRKVEVKDMNNDGKPDIVALMGQAYEGVDIYYNNGNNIFEKKRVLEFSPVYGLGYFELADFNGDGLQDFLISNGDNRDFSPIDKPYHGVRVYLNKKENRFEEVFFFPMYDCHKAMASDFDNDGDLDIIAASLYSDYTAERTKDKAVVYLENNGNLDFTPSYMANPIHGNWLSMEILDFDKDGFDDVVLGAFLYDLNELVRVSKVTGVTSFSQVLLLTNKH
ncbi:FG-GAP repeat domain-containing protein [Maribacter sp. 2210JD10-5]|uniref:FG-GAP repeat domain-containing protein n=1 Tax=Maribacter sp. 2210JD10-5 TaxID=3386272 RepID=UPI0039BCF540